jgi:hypothetical protein
MKAYKSLVKFALDNNAKVSVWDGEEWAVKKGTKYQTIIDAIESVDISEIRLRDANEDVIGWALIVLDNEDDATVSDFTITPFMATWESQYYK